MKQNDEYYLQQFKNQMDRGNNFIEYFMTIGLPDSIIFDNYVYEHELKVLNSSNKCQPEIISQFPEFTKSSIKVDESIIKVKFM